MAIPSLRISPDLGWLDTEQMLDPAINPAVVEIPQAELVVSTETPRWYFGPMFRVLRVEGVVYEIPEIYVRQLTGTGLRHYYRIVTAVLNGEIGSFRLLTDPPPVNV